MTSRFVWGVNGAPGTEACDEQLEVAVLHGLQYAQGSVLVLHHQAHSRIGVQRGSSHPKLFVYSVPGLSHLSSL